MWGMQPRDNSFSFSRNKQIFLFFLSKEKSLTVEKTGGKLRKLNCKIPKQCICISNSLHVENDCCREATPWGSLQTRLGLTSSHSSREKPLPIVIKTFIQWKLFEKIADLVRLIPDKMKLRCHEWLLWGPLPSHGGWSVNAVVLVPCSMPFSASPWWTKELPLCMPGVYSLPSNRRPPKESYMSSYSSFSNACLLSSSDSWGSRDYAIFWATILPLFSMKRSSKWQAYTQYGPP